MLLGKPNSNTGPNTQKYINQFSNEMCTFSYMIHKRGMNVLRKMKQFEISSLIVGIDGWFCSVRILSRDRHC